MAFAYRSGGPNPLPQTFTLSAIGGVSGFTAAASGGSWFSVSPTSGSTPASLSVSVNPTGLNPGTYNGSVTITAPGAGNSPQTVAVSLTVTSAPTLSISANSLNYAYQTGSSLPQAQAVSVTANSATTF